MAGFLNTLLGAPVKAPAPPAAGGGLASALGAGSLPSLPGSLPSVPSVGGLDAVLAAAGTDAGAAASQGVQQAAAAAAAAAQAGVSQATQAANAAAVAALDKYGMAPAVVSVENGDYASAAEEAGWAALNDVGIPPVIANGVSLIEADAAQATTTTVVVAEAIAWAIQEGLLTFLGPAAIAEITSILATMGVTTATGAAVGSAVPVVGTAIGAIIGAFVAMGQEIANAYPCDAKQLTYQQFWRFADLGTLKQGGNCGALQLVAGKGTASDDDQKQREATLETILQTIVARIRSQPQWQESFLAIYVALRKGDSKTPGLFVWAPINGYQYLLADEVFRRLGDDFADWWIQQPGWLSALGGLPVLPVSYRQIWTSTEGEGPGGDAPSLYWEAPEVAEEILAGYQAYAKANGLTPPDHITQCWDTSGHVWNFQDPKDPLEISTKVWLRDHGQVASNLPARLADHIPGAIGRAILNRYAITPHNATPGDWALAMLHASQAADALGSKAVSDYVGAHISEVGPQVGYKRTTLAPWGLQVMVPFYGPPGVAVPAGVIPLAAPIWRSSAIGGGAAPLSPGLFGTKAPPATPGQTLVGKLGGLHTAGGSLGRPPTAAPILIANPPTIDVPTAGSILGAAAGGDAGAGAYVAGTVASANSGHPTGIANAEQFTRAQRLNILAGFASRWVSPAAGNQVRAGLVLR